MIPFHALLVAAVLAAPARADQSAVRAAMAEALREAAPLPSARPVLPEGPLPAGRLTEADRAMRRDAERTAVEHARKNVDRAGREGRGESGRHGEMGESMREGHQEGPSVDPAEMMRSRGMMPGSDGQPAPMPHRGM